MFNILMNVLLKYIIHHDVSIPYICSSLYLKYHSLSSLANLSKLECHFPFQVIFVITSLLHLCILSYLFRTIFVHLSVSSASFGD